MTREKLKILNTEMYSANIILVTVLSVKTEPQKAYFSLFKNMVLGVLYINIHFGLHLTFLKQVTAIHLYL